MCYVALIPLAIGAVSGLMSGMGQRDQANAQAAELRTNAIYLNRAANDALARGRTESDLQRTQTQQMIGTQRTAQAANGGEINTGTNAIIQQDTAQLGELDALTISNNAAREAYGYQVQAASNTQNAATIAAAGKKAVMSSVIGGAVGGFSSGGGSFGGLFGGGAKAAAPAGAGTNAALSTNLNRINYNQSIA